MKLLLRQRFFSWFDSYDIYDESENTIFKVKGELSFGHMFNIYDQNDNLIGRLKEQVFRFLPHFTMYENDVEVGEIVKEFTFFRPKFTLSCSDWVINGDVWGWDYSIVDSNNVEIASISKQLFNFTDTYVLDIVNNKDALRVLMIVLAIDAIKCNNKNN